MGKDNDQMFYVMRYMPGGSLSDRMASPLSLEESIRIVQRIAGALDYAHARGVIHRDLKPGNILFDDEGNAFISDFGIAKLASGQNRLTISGIIGTPSYMSPEQAVGDNVDGRSDIYSLGVILFEMLSGKLPYEATSRRWRWSSSTPTNPSPQHSDINPNLPPGIENILEKAMAKNPRAALRHRRRTGELTMLALLPPGRHLPRRSRPFPLLPQPILLPPLAGGAGLFPPAIVPAAAGWGWWGSRAAPSATPAPSPPAAPTQTVALPPPVLPTATASPTPTRLAHPASHVHALASRLPPRQALAGRDKIALVTNKDIWVIRTWMAAG